MSDKTPEQRAWEAVEKSSREMDRSAKLVSMAKLTIKSQKARIEQLEAENKRLRNSTKSAIKKMERAAKSYRNQSCKTPPGTIAGHWRRESRAIASGYEGAAIWLREALTKEGTDER